METSVEELKREIEQLRQEKITLVDALEPFAQHADDIASNRQELVLRDEDFLRAKDALAKVGK